MPDPTDKAPPQDPPQASRGDTPQPAPQPTPQPAPQAAPQPPHAPPEVSPADTFKQGMGLLWKAAVSTVAEIKQEVNKGGVTDSLKQAGRELEDAANQAATALESFIERVAPQAKPAAQPQHRWPAPHTPPAPNAGPAPDATATAPVPAPAPTQPEVPSPNPPQGDAATTEGAEGGGEMRIQIDE